MKLVILDMLNDIITQEQWSIFDIFENVEKYDNTMPEETAERIIDADAIITNKVILGENELKEAKNLKYIGVVATGYNVVDIEFAKKRGIAITNVPFYGTDTVSEFTIGMMLTIARRYELHNQAMLDGIWKEKNIFSFNLTPQFDLCGKTLGIIGFGKIGNRVSEIAKAFKMDVLVLERHGNFRIEGDINFVSLEDLLKNSDFVTLHCNLTDENYHMVNMDFLSKMKPSSYLLNMSRGNLINEVDLTYALNHDIIAGAGLDTVSIEPIEDTNPLLNAKNVIITPHMAWLSKEAINRILNTALENLKKFQIGVSQNRVV